MPSIVTASPSTNLSAGFYKTMKNTMDIGYIDFNIKFSTLEKWDYNGRALI